MHNTFVQFSSEAIWTSIAPASHVPLRYLTKYIPRMLAYLSMVYVRSTCLSSLMHWSSLFVHKSYVFCRAKSKLKIHCLIIWIMLPSRWPSIISGMRLSICVDSTKHIKSEYSGVQIYKSERVPCENAITFLVHI